jgi:two-component system, cell cycle sensor histidine kinase and response regulator CckA
MTKTAGHTKQEEALKEIAANFASFPFPLYGTDVEGNVIFWNENMVLFSGITANKAVGKSIHGVSKKLFGDSEGFILEGLCKGRPYIGGKDVKHEDLVFAGRILPRLFGGSNIRLFSFSHADTAGKKIMFVEGIGSLAAHGDFPSPLRNLFPAQAKRTEFPYELMNRVELLKRFIATFTHQYNNIFAAILQNAEFLLSDPSLTAETRKAISSILISSSKGKRIGRSLLAFEGVFGEVKTFDVNEVIISLNGFMAAVMGNEKNIAFALSDEIPYVQLREGLLEEFFFIVLSLCSSISKKGTKVLIETCRNRPIKAASRLKERDLVSISLRVSTISLPVPDFISSLDLKIRKNKARDIFGSIRKDLLESGAKLEIQPYKRGVLFQLALKGSIESVTFEKWRGEDLPKGRGTILLLDDEAALRDILRLTLERLGYSVHTADSIRTARGLFLKLGDKIDLLITDIVLPDGNGFDFCKEISSGCAFPTLIISGFSNVALPSSVDMDEQNMAFLAKPFTRAEFAEKVKRMIGS